MIATGLSCGIDRYSACAPNAPSQYPKTRSPTANDVTAEPTASTLPANSLPSTVARGFRTPLNSLTMNGCLTGSRSRFGSLWSIDPDQAIADIVVGHGTSAIPTTSGGPYLVWTAAFTPGLYRSRRRSHDDQGRTATTIMGVWGVL